METLTSVLARCTSLELQSRTSEAMDVLTEHIDNLLLENEFESMDDFLGELRVGDYSTDILITILTATLSASSELSKRSDFVERVSVELELRGEPVASLMKGLG
ncbi:MAG: hypothetical protein RLZZ347_489 [Candidatus Parcubacteria bacterium]|jgi:hypothetical protein